MNLDIYSFAIALGIIYSIQIIIFFLEYQYHKNLKGPGWWFLWSASSVVAFIAMLTRQIKVVEPISILVQNVMFILAAIFLYVGIMHFLEKKARLKLMISIVVVVIIPLAYYTFAEDNIQIRSILIWSSVVVCGSIAVYDIFRSRIQSVRMALNICILVLSFHVFYAAFKVIMLLTVTSIENINSQSFVNTSSYIEVLIVSVFLTYALIMMISQRLRDEADRSKDFFEIIFNTTPDVILITSLSEGIITSVNYKFCEITGYNMEESLGKTTADLNLWVNNDDRKEFISEVKKNGYFFDYEAQFRLKDQSFLTGLVSCKTINLLGKLHMLTIIRDITERKKIEKETIIQNEQLKGLIREKDKFFSIIAHDLKGPLSSFLGLTEIMADEVPNLPLSEVIQLAKTMRDSSRNLYGLLENLLEWSLVRQGLAKFEPETLALYPEVNESILSYWDTAQKKQISIETKIAAEELVYADRNMLKTLIRNLLSNAIKFTHQGGLITVAAETLNDGKLLISVQDNGIGLNQVLKDRIFKIDSNSSRPGTDGELSCGLGLLLSKEFVSMHGGEIWVESEEGEGSTFYVKMPNGNT